MSKNWIFVVDTDSYSGNFERDLCAYMTGQVGDCGVGGEAAEAFRAETGLDDDALDFVASKPDERGCWRPCEIWPTPGYFNNGLGGGFRDGQETEALDAYRKACRDEAGRRPYGDQYEQSNVDHAARWNARAEARGPVQKFPSCQSVAIFMNRRPSPEQVAFLVNRASGFSAFRAKSEYEWERSRIGISGYRLLSEESSITTELEIGTDGMTKGGQP